MVLAAVCAAALVIDPPPAQAHDGLREQIQVLNSQLAAGPPRADLLLRRGDLHRAVGELSRAGADLDHAESLDPALASVHLARARLRMAEGRPREAVASATTFLASEARHVEARLIRARAHAQAGSRADAVADFSDALAERPTPDIYLERARLLASAPADLEAALRGLDEGLTRLGPLVTLDLEAIAVEVRLRRYDAALRRIDAQAARAARKEQWLARRGAVLTQAGRTTQAAAAYRAALDATSALPARTRGTAATIALVRDIQQHLDRLAPSDSPAPKGQSTTP